MATECNLPKRLLPLPPAAGSPYTTASSSALPGPIPGKAVSLHQPTQRNKTHMAQEKAETVTVKKPAEKLAESPAVALVPETPAEPKRRGRPPAAAKTAATTTTTVKRPRKTGNNGVLFLAETGEDSGLFEIRPSLDVTEVLELGEEGRRILATRKWREF